MESIFRAKMARLTIFLSIVTVVLSVCCNLFTNESGSSVDLEWKKTSLPGDLKGRWYVKSVYYMGIFSSKVIIDNREWIIVSIEKKDDEYRITVKSTYQYRSIYFTNLTDTNVEKSEGYFAISDYDAKQAERSEWSIMTKE